MLKQVYQDGRQFYDAETDELLYEYPWPVQDADVERAKIARAAFLSRYPDAEFVS